MATVEELREELLTAVIILSLAENDETQEKIKKATTVEVDSLIAAAREEGAEQERERIRQQGVSVAKGESIETPLTHLGYWDSHENLYADVSIVLIPSSVLSPAPKEVAE